MRPSSTILVVDDDPNLRKTLTDIMRVKGYETLVATSGAEAIAAVRQTSVSLALIDLRLPDMSGLDVMERIKLESPLTEAIILTGHASMDTAIEATKRGAFCYLLKPYQIDDLLLNIRHGIDRHQAQAEIARLSEALKQTQQAIVIADTDFRFEYVNSAYTRLFGYSLEEVAGQSISLMDVPGYQNNPVQASITATEQGMFSGEVLRRTKDGTVIPVLVNIAPILDKQGKVANFVGTMSDLSNIRRMEESLRESEEKFRSISSAAQDAIIMLDEHGAISFWNTSAESIFGYASEEVLGKDLHTLCAPVRYRQAFLSGFDKFINTGQGAAVGKTLELAALRKDGSEFPIEISLSSVRHKDKWLAIGIVRDISERKRAERDMQVYIKKLEQAQSQLLQSEKMASIGLLAAGVAHEINNPIGFVSSNLATLSKYVNDFLRLIEAFEKSQIPSQGQKEVSAETDELKRTSDFAFEKEDVLALLSESQHGIGRVIKIVQNLKDFSHVDAVENWAEEDIHKGLESTLTVIWNELKYTCEVVKEYGDLPPVQCLISQLNQVFMNLLINAAQAIETKGTITIRTGTQDDWVWVEISDTGKGIDPKHLDRIFEPFFTTKPVGKGTGLGLSVSYRLIEKHHGRIEVQSEVGKGSTFRVWLPVRQPATGEQP